MSALQAHPVIQAPDLVLRPVHADDLPALMAVNGDAEVTRFLPYRRWQSADDAAAWLERMQALQATGTALQLVLQRRADDAVLGTLLLFRLDADSRRIELGYVLGRAHWGQGWMRRAVLAACAHVFGPLALHRIEAEVNPANRASCALLLRCGFTHEGTLRQRWRNADGEPYDVQVFGRLATDPEPAGAISPA